jgi:WD40 repeat protein
MMTLKKFVCASVLLCACDELAQTPASLPELPSPTRILQDEKQFNATTLGPGNRITVQQTPPDFQLDSFDFSPDGKWTFMSWASGRLEVRESQTGKRIAQFKPMSGPVFEADYNEQTKQLLVTGKHGVIRFVDPHSGKVLREIHTEIGKFKYDLQKVVVAQDGSWLAYINQDNGKVLDLKSEPPRSLADLGDAYELALTRDGSELWLINRERIYGLKTGAWSKIASAPLLDKVRPDNTPTIAVASVEQSAVAFLPSQSGLLRYELNTMTSRKVTANPTYWVALDAARNEVLVNERQSLSLYGADGSLHCQWKQHPSQNLKVSGNGEWLGSLNFGKVELWSLDSLEGSCQGHKP